MEHQDWTRVREVVTEEINRWDPLGLMDAGAPSDEFEPEIKELVLALRRIKCEEELALKMIVVFEEMFSLPFYYTYCLNVTKRIWERLRWGTT